MAALSLGFRKPGLLSTILHPRGTDLQCRSGLQAPTPNVDKGQIKTGIFYRGLPRLPPTLLGLALRGLGFFGAFAFFGAIRKCTYLSLLISTYPGLARPFIT